MARVLPKSLLIPVETLNREFDAKLLLSLFAVGAGFEPVIGSRQRMYDEMPAFPESIYLSKGLRVGNRAHVSLLDKLGHIVVGLDEEALLRQSDDMLLLMLDDETFNRFRLLYAWGESNAAVWRRFSGYHGTPILNVGNPRLDLLRPELRPFFAEDIQHLKSRYGPYVLFSTNFSLANHFMPGFVRVRFAGKPDEEASAFKQALVAHKVALFEAFKALVPRLARAIAPANLVIRPHPSENIDSWKAVAREPNIHVVHEGPIAPWIMAATALIHNGCTSAVEAALIGTPAHAYRPVRAEGLDIDLPNAVSRNYDTEDDVIDALRGALDKPEAGGVMRPEHREILAEHIASLDGPLSSQRIVDSLITHRAELEATPYRGAVARLGGLAVHTGRTTVRAVTERIGKPGRSGKDYTAHKYPGLETQEVNERIARLRAALPSLPAGEAREMMPGIFAVEAA